MELPAIFSDNMVLQHSSTVTIWGWADNDETITVRGNWGETATVYADNSGRWEASLSTGEPGGPYQLTIANNRDTVQLDDVLLGEVWLCSGQSNMEMPLQGWPPQSPIPNSDKIIASADHPDIRLFTVNRAMAAQPEEDCRGVWQKCTSNTAATFSAAAYFFGRKLRQELNVPIGLVHSSWGGTPIESWMSAEALGTLEAFQPVIRKINASIDEIDAYDQWLDDHPQINIRGMPGNPWATLELEDEMCALPEFDDSRWNTMVLPTLWEESELGQFDGIVWFRRTVEIPGEWSDRDLLLSLGPVDDMDATYFNGERIGAIEQEGFWEKERRYTVPAEVVQTGMNTVAVRVIDNGGGGGIYGDQPRIHPKEDQTDVISLTGFWKYLPVAEYRDSRLFLFGIKNEEFLSRPEVPITVSQNTPTFLYNGMIAPVVPYSIRGVIWYQGESNTGNPEQYRTLFPTMIRDWRNQFAQGTFPFYYVQIAPYAYGEESESQRLREAQFQTLSVPNTGMAVTLDIGEVQDIHPSNKQEVGRRLALWALANTYDHHVVYSGPLYRSMETKNGEIILQFDYVNDGLKAKGEALEHFRIAGPDSVFRPARAEIRGEKVVVWHPEIGAPVAVRYAWNNTSEASLFNDAGLPASSFRTDDWDN